MQSFFCANSYSIWHLRNASGAVGLIKLKAPITDHGIHAMLSAKWKQYIWMFCSFTVLSEF
jgi:hypothetical protein